VAWADDFQCGAQPPQDRCALGAADCLAQARPGFVRAQLRLDRVERSDVPQAPGRCSRRVCLIAPGCTSRISAATPTPPPASRR
jgi:hypothetical protein